MPETRPARKVAALMDEHDIDRLRALEASLWHHGTRFDRDHLEATLATGFLEHGRSGRIYTRQDVLGTPPIDFEARLSQLEVRAVTDEVAIVTYRSEFGTGDDVEFANRVSIWRRVGDDWQIEFHQGTPVE